jgi:hypothetical protein
MQNKYRAWLFTIIFYTAAILGLCLALAFIYVVFTGLVGGTEIFQAPLYFRTLGNISFFAGALVFTFGAFLEFFVKARSPSIGRTMMLPHEIWSKRFALEDKDREARLMDESSSGGWMLIAIGALAIIASAAFAFISMK